MAGVPPQIENRSYQGQPMKQTVENTVDAAKEKHVPVIEKYRAASR
jgi:desulfoferrodoxin (superoxide reductase-like protein)